MTRIGAKRVWIAAAGGVALLLVTAGLLVWPGITYDAGRLKPRIAAAIREATGRDVEIAGPLRLALSYRPTLQADQVTVGNAPGFAAGPMATVGRIDLRLALLPLLHRRIEVEELDLVRPTVSLAVNEAGAANWTFRRPASAPSSDAAPTGAPAQAAVRAPTRLHVATVRVTGGSADFHDARTGAALAITGIDLTGTQAALGDPVRLDGTATLGGTSIVLSGTIAPAGAQPVAIDLAAKVGDARVSLAGNPNALRIAADIPSLAALSSIAGTPLPAVTSLSVAADLAPIDPAAPLHGVVLRGLKAASPLGEVSGEARVALGSPPVVKATLSARNLDLAALRNLALAAAPPIAASAPPAPSQPPAAAPQPAPPTDTRTWVIPDETLPFALLPRLDADVTLASADARIGSFVIGKSAVHAVLHDRRLVLDPVSFDLPGGHADVSATVTADGAVALHVDAPALALQPLLAALDQPDGVSGSVAVRMDLRGQGTSPHRLAAGMDGKVGIALANGDIDNRLLIALLSKVAPEAGLLDLARKPDRSPVRCIAMRWDFSSGTGDARALLLDTAPLRLSGSGTVDLAQETLALRLQPLVRVGASGISVPVDVRGGFRSLRATVDASGSAKGQPLAGIVIGALGADRLIAGAGQADTCPDQLRLARFDQSGPIPPAPAHGEAQKGTTTNLNNILKQLLR
ncbi:MAG: AsmA family protein [Proteobacteria bacterium]|nr:AsmA family protein [Pseudomonadota bacterium]